MKFLPIDNITYKTRLKEDETIQELANIINIIKSKKIFKLTRLYRYEGQINGKVFDMKKVILDENQYEESRSCLPDINGIILKDYNGTIIKVKMRLHIRSIIFLCIFFAILGFILIMALFARHLLSIPISIFSLLAYGLVMVSFKYESTKSIKDFQELFQAEIIEK